jgi:acetyl-CoA carboxylase carboxyltransferase component
MAENDIPSDWAILLDEYQRRMAAGRAMGGKEKLAKRKRSGRLNARQMVEQLLDQDSFMELGTLVGGLSYGNLPTAPADALIGGIGQIDKRTVVIGAEDFTVQGGSIGHGTAAKRLRLARLAARERVPFIMILDGAGARATNALERHPYAPNDLQELAALSGIVPTIALVIGSSAGHGALTGLLMDFVIMLESATLFSAGPPLVAAALGEVVTKEQLGSATMHASKSGVCHNLAKDEKEACRLVRRYLDYFPQNAWQRTPVSEPGEAQGPRRLDSILRHIPKTLQIPYDIKPVITMTMDADSVLEIQPHYGTAMVTCLARLGGHAVAILANQPTVMAGSIDRNAAEKAAHFIELIDAFHLPAIFLADNPGIMSGSKAEQAGTLRAAARMYSAQSRIRGSKLHVTLRKAFGFGSSLMAMNPFDEQTLTLAFPGISLGGIPALGGANATKADEETRAQMALAETSGAWSAGDTMAYDQIIDPRELRNALLSGLELSINRYSESPQPARHSGIRP